MGALNVFTFMSLDGRVEGATRGDISWHPHDPEGEAFASEGMQGEGMLLFGRVTYEMMVRFWPTPAAAQAMPAVAAGMNRAEKLVFSRTLTHPTWANTRVVKEDLAGAVRALKQNGRKPMTILGSGSIVTQLALAGLIDTYQMMVDPVALGAGTSAFQGLAQPLRLELTGTRAFKNGCVLLSYRRAG